MKKLVNYFSIAFILALVYCIMPTANANVDQGSNHRKDCFLWIDGCKHKVDRNCFGGNCKEEPHLEEY